MKKILTLIAFALTLQLGFSQTLEQYEAKATEAYEAKNWSKALSYNTLLLEIDSTRNDARYFGGVSAHNMRSYQVGKEMLSKIPEESRVNDFGLTNFLLGNISKGLEDYAGALANYSIFLDQNHLNLQEYVARANAELDYCEWALEQKSNPANTEIVHLSSQINTIHSDLSPFADGNSLYYSTSLTEGEYEDKNRIKILRATDLQNATPIEISSDEKFMHIANYKMNDARDRIVYTLCDASYKCEIFQMRKQADGYWSSKERLNDKVNMAGYNNTNPSLGRDAESGMELLFFSSNRPGGKGQMDIWCSVITTEGNISVPVNIPEINSYSDDITPFFLNETQTLYFSSTGQKGMGGFDIYTSQKEGNNWGQATNLGYPTNGGYDEIYYTFDALTGDAYYSSNRPGAICEDIEKDCISYDIYSIPIHVDLEVLTFNTVDSSNLLGARVELLNLTTDIVDTFYVHESDNFFAFPLLLNMDYRITASKEGFSTVFTEITTKGITTTTTLKESLYLMPTITLEVITYDKISREYLSGTTVFFNNLVSSDLTRTVNTETTYKCDYVLEFGEKYSVSAEKLGYTSSEILTFSTEGINTPTKIIKELYLQPFKGLPITLYFDNDYPNPRTLNTTCDKTYDVTFDRYITQKRTFQNGFSKGMLGEEKDRAEQEVADFFEKEVQKGFDQLMDFSETLVNYFQLGTIDTIEIEVQGYASPLAASDYNKKLTSRRVDSVVNHFEKYEGGIFLQYIQEGRIKFIEKPNGEDLANPDISPDYNDRRQSVFNPAASRERRVKILDVRRKDGFLSSNE